MNKVYTDAHTLTRIEPNSNWLPLNDGGSNMVVAAIVIVYEAKTSNSIGIVCFVASDMLSSDRQFRIE